MFKQMTLHNRKSPFVVSTLLLGCMVASAATPALAEHRRNNWNRKAQFSAGSSCRSDARQDYRSYQRNNYYQRDNYYRSQPVRYYQPQRYYQPYRSDRLRGYNQYQTYGGNWNEGRYRGYEPRSTAESALIIAGSSGAGAAIGGLLGGTKGAAVGAIAGGVAGVVYDQHTDNRR